MNTRMRNRWFVAATAGYLLLGSLPSFSAQAQQVELTPAKDASLYQFDYDRYDPAQPNTYPKADGTGHLHVGDTNNNNGVQRGLLQFDFGPDVLPHNAVVTSASLTMTVADVPNRVLQRDIRFWLVPMEGLSSNWAQGPGIEQSPAVAGDTTWFHTRYDPAVHGELDNAGNPLLDFSTTDPGYWPAPGYFGQDDLMGTAPGEDIGGPLDDAYALVFDEGSDVGDTFTWSNNRLVSDVQAWVDGTKDNFGWIMVGEEWITGEQTVIRPDNGKEAPASSKIDFFSSESAGPYYSPPLLTVTYQVVPEPSSILLLAIGLAMFWWRWRKRGAHHGYSKSSTTSSLKSGITSSKVMDPSRCTQI